MDLSDYHFSKNVTLSWQNISYYVDRRRKNNNFLYELLRGAQVETVQVLNKVHGIIKSGSLTAIMGPSGAGKTSFLAAISLRIKGKLLGEVLLNDEPVDIKIMSRVSSFVAQHDLFIESLTIQEHMEFMARMTMDRRSKSLQRNKRISKVLAELGLSKCSSTRLSNLSCGERKRTSLAVQLLTEPSILFCDEPTTGLDSFAAMSVIRTLKNVSTRGCIVICSLHQPASGLLELFDEIILMSNGRLAFQGSLIEALNFFKSIGMQCPITFNCAEFLVKQLSSDQVKEAKNQEKIKWICNQFEKSVYSKRILQAFEESRTNLSITSTIHPIFSIELLPINKFKKVGALTQLYWLTWRICIDHKRNLSTIFLRFSLYMFISLLLSTPYIGITKSIDQKGIQSIQGLLYLIITETIFTFNYSVFHTFPNELPYLLRDISNGLYNPAPYYISKILISIPIVTLQSVIYATFIYNVVGFNSTDCNFILFLIPIILCAFSASAIGYSISSIFKTIETASLFSVPVDFLTLIFSGLFLQLTDLPSHIGWIKYISQFYYGVEALSLTQWESVTDISCSNDIQQPCISTGTMVLQKYGYTMDNYLVDCLGLLSISLIGHIAGFFAVKTRSLKEAAY